jgi:hypothetical protein
MVHLTIAILFFFAVVSCGHKSNIIEGQTENPRRSYEQLDISDEAEILRASRKIAAAFVDGNWDVVLGSMDRRYYEKLGLSKENMDAELASIKKDFEESGVKFLRCEPIEPDEIHRLEPYTIAFVATKNEMTVKGTTVAGTGLLIAAKYRGGSNWWFLDGTSMDRDEILNFYPELPRDCKIPAIKIEVKK